MKLRGQQNLSRQEQKLISQLRTHFGKSELRSKGQKTYTRHKSNMTRIATGMAANGYQNVSDFKLRTYKAIMDTAAADGLSKSALESLSGTMLKLADVLGKGNIRTHAELFKRDNRYYRTGVERIKPQFHSSTDARMVIQTRIEEKDPAVGIATLMSFHSGVRKEESLASCELLRKDATGRLYTTHKMLAGEFREVNVKQLRYAFTENRKDASFEQDYLWNMKPGIEYVVVTASWAKLGKARLVPVFDSSQRVAAITAQQFIRQNKALAAAYDRKISSVISPDRTRGQGYDHAEYVIRAAGMTKKTAGFSLHADRTEFNLRMKATGLFSTYERTLALGHSDTRKLAMYGG